MQGLEIIASWLQSIYLHLEFSSKATRLLIREHRLDSLERLRVLTEKNLNDICNVGRKTGGKNVNVTPDRGQQVLITAQENLKIAVFLFHHWWRYTFD